MIYITGTTKGLGKSLLEKYQSIGSNVFGMNRPTYDLSKDISSLVRKDFDIYILNAQYEWGQVDLLYSLFEKNRDRKCTIIAIGSVSADGDRKEVNRYAIQKKALDAACCQLQLCSSTCTVTQIKLGRMNTDLVKHISAPKMDTDRLANFIVNLIISNNDEFYTKTITVDNV